MDVLKFIRSVEQRECIYNKASAHYRHRDIVFDSWRAIAREMKVSVLECKEKWHNLRSNYMRERKKSLGPGVKKWHLLDPLSFLEPHYCARGPNGPRRRSRQPEGALAILPILNTIKTEDEFEPPMPLNNVTSTEQFSSDEMNDDGQTLDYDTCNQGDMQSIEENEMEAGMAFPPSESVSLQSPVMKKRRRHSKWKNIDLEYLRQVRKLAKNLDQPAEDPDRMFLLSLQPLMQQLGPKDKVDFRVEVQQILQKKLQS